MCTQLNNLCFRWPTETHGLLAPCHCPPPLLLLALAKEFSARDDNMVDPGDQGSKRVHLRRSKCEKTDLKANKLLA